MRQERESEREYPQEFVRIDRFYCLPQVNGGMRQRRQREYPPKKLMQIDRFYFRPQMDECRNEAEESTPQNSRR